MLNSLIFEDDFEDRPLLSSDLESHTNVHSGGNEMATVHTADTGTFPFFHHVPTIRLAICYLDQRS